MWLPENPSACWLPVAIAVVSGSLKVLERRVCLEHLATPTLHLSLVVKVSTLPLSLYCRQRCCPHLLSTGQMHMSCRLLRSTELGNVARPGCVDSYSPNQLSSYGFSYASPGSPWVPCSSVATSILIEGPSAKLGLGPAPFSLLW